MAASTFGDVLRHHRMRIPLTQEELAERTGVSVRAIGDIERGHAARPRRRTVVLLAAGLALGGAESAEFARLAQVDEVLTGAALPGAALPAKATALIGRQREHAALTAFVRETGLPRIVLVHGWPGVGKTALALAVAHRQARRFPDGRLFVDLRGLAEQPLTPAQAARILLRGCGIAEARIPADPDEVLALYRSVLDERAVLLVLDNAADEAQVRALVTAGPGTVVLVTSRRTLSGLHVRHRLALDLLGHQDTAALLRQVVGSRRVGAEPAAARQVARWCGGLPLAVQIAGNRIASRPQWTIAHLAERLVDPRHRLSALTAGDLQLRPAFALSYRRLGPVAAELFRRLSTAPAPAPAVDVGLATAVTGRAAHLAEAALEELAEAGLLALGAAPGHYTRAELLNAYAAELLALEEPAAGGPRQQAHPPASQLAIR